MKNILRKRILYYWNPLLRKTFPVSHFPTFIPIMEMLLHKHFFHPRTTTEIVFCKMISHLCSLLKILFFITKSLLTYFNNPSAVIKASKHNFTYLKMLSNNLLFNYRRPPPLSLPENVAAIVVYYMTDGNNWRVQEAIVKKV